LRCRIAWSEPSTGAKILRVGDDEGSADRFVLATGSRPRIPPVPGLAEIPYRTSDDIMRLDTLPKSMAVLGGGEIAAEMSHVFASLGTTVTTVTGIPPQVPSPPAP
jgi:mycothione reductase